MQGATESGIQARGGARGAANERKRAGINCCCSVARTNLSWVSTGFSTVATTSGRARPPCIKGRQKTQCRPWLSCSPGKPDGCWTGLCSEQISGSKAWSPATSFCDSEIGWAGKMPLASTLTANSRMAAQDTISHRAFIKRLRKDRFPGLRRSIFIMAFNGSPYGTSQSTRKPAMVNFHIL